MPRLQPEQDLSGGTILVLIVRRNNARTYQQNSRFAEQADISSAAPTPGLSWATMKAPWSAYGGKSAAKPSPEDLSGNLIVQLGLATEALNRHWFEPNTGQSPHGVQRQVQHPVVRWMARTLDGIVEATGAVFEAKFMLPWSFSRGGRGRKIYAAAAAQHVGH